jgi:hypothetical protein
MGAQARPPPQTPRARPPRAAQARAEARFGPGHQEAADAARACRAAARARYGSAACVGPRLLELLVDTRAALDVEG